MSAPIMGVLVLLISVGVVSLLETWLHIWYCNTEGFQFSTVTEGSACSC